MLPGIHHFEDMTKPENQDLASLQQGIVDVVRKYPQQFYCSELAKLLVGAKSYEGRGIAEYGRFAHHRRKAILYQVDILLQQGYLALDAFNHLVVSEE